MNLILAVPGADGSRLETVGDRDREPGPVGRGFWVDRDRDIWPAEVTLDGLLMNRPPPLELNNLFT